MSNKTHLLKLWVHIHEKEETKIVIPLLVHLQCLQAYLDDIADIAGLFPENATINKGQTNQKTATMGMCAATAKSFANILGDLHGFRVKAKIKEKKGKRVHVDIHAI